MSQFTNFSENKLVDFLRGQGTAWLPSGFYIGLATAASDGSVTECSGGSYARQAYARSLSAWAGTQGSGSTLASSGVSHTTSNNNSISFGTSTAAWGTVTHAIIYDASTGGNALAYCALASTISVGSSSAVSLAIGAIALSLGLAGGCSDYFANKLIDLFFRGQSYTAPANLYFGLFTAAPTNAGGGTEVAGGAYARQSLPGNLAAFAGTQGATTTAVSSGTSGLTSNNAAVAFPTPSANWGTITHEAVFDASSGGNMLFWNALDVARSVLASSSPQTHAVSTWSLTFD
jgi:hypothetical protein